jgi:hypothetical protein
MIKHYDSGKSIIGPVYGRNTIEEQGDFLESNKQLKHTPAPWLNGGDEITDGTDRTSDESDICYMNCDSSDDNYIANARLISCAPEMLDERIKYYDGIDSNGNVYLRIPKEKYIELTERATGEKIKDVLK